MKKRIMIFLLIIIMLLNTSAIVNAKIEIKEKTIIKASEEKYEQIEFSIWEIFIAQEVTIGQDFLFAVDFMNFSNVEVLMVYLGKGNVKVKNWENNSEYILSLPIGEPFDLCVIIGDFRNRIIIEDLVLEEVENKTDCIRIKSFGEIRGEKLSE